LFEMGKKDKHSMGNATGELQDRDDAAEGAGANSKDALEDLTQGVHDVAQSVSDVGEKGARAAASAKQLVAEKAHEGAVALRRRRRQGLAMMVAGASLLVAAVARRVARRA
jgi:hypothetical protein